MPPVSASATSPSSTASKNRVQGFAGSRVLVPDPNPGTPETQNPYLIPAGGAGLLNAPP